MSEPMMLSVAYRNDKLEFPFSVVAQRFQTRYIVTVHDVTFTFERDDAGELRTVIYDEAQKGGKVPDVALLRPSAAYYTS